MPVLDRAQAALNERSVFVSFSTNARPLSPHLDELTSPDYERAYVAFDRELEKSIDASAFLSAERHFAALRSQLNEIGRANSRLGCLSVERASMILTALRHVLFAPSRIVLLRDEPGVGLTFHNGSRRAELEVLDDGGAFLTMYDREGPINVTEPALDRDISPMLSRIREFLAR